MSAGFYQHVLNLPARFYAQRFAGEISSRVGINTDVADVLSGELAGVYRDLLGAEAE